MIVEAITLASAGTAAIVAVRWLVEAAYDYQRPLSAYSREDFYLAFRRAPEFRAEIVNRGTMSRNEFIALQELNLERIGAELRRRWFRK